MGCPYEGKVPIESVVKVTNKLFEYGCYEVSLGDTIGVGTPGSTFNLIKELKKTNPIDKIAVHFHDTYGQALTNILVALTLGIRTIDSSIAGLGCCPYAKGASGNIATEEVVYMLRGLGIDCGVNLDELVKAGTYISGVLGRNSSSKVGLATERKGSLPPVYFD